MKRNALFQPPRSTANFLPLCGRGDRKTSELFHSGGHDPVRKERIVRHTAEELAGMTKRGETRSNWKKAAAMSDEQLEASIAANPDEAGMVMDWDSVTVELPKSKADLHMRVDRDVLDFFRKTGKGYQTRINAVLRSYVSRMRGDDSSAQ